jgi:predicted lipoprotein
MAPFSRSRGRLPSALLLIPLLLAGCGSAPPGGPSAAEEDRSAAVAQAFVAKVVLPGYGQLAQRSQQLAERLDQLAAHPDARRLQAAREAWAAARRSWETAESWAFGPAQTQGFDTNLDDWPVNEKDLRTALARAPVSPALFAQLTSTARGFHGIEAVLHGFSAPAPRAEQLSPAQLRYLQLAGHDLARQSRGLLQAWQGPSGFGARFAGRGDNPGEAVTEILQGMLGTLQEVSAEKLGKPLASRSPSDLESFYSGTTQADVVANLAGIQEGLERTGLQQLINRRDGAAGRALVEDFAMALERVRQLPKRLDASLADAAGRSRISAAIEAIDRCATTLQRISEGWG